MKSERSFIRISRPSAPEEFTEREQVRSLLLGWLEFASGAAFLNYFFLVVLDGVISNPLYVDFLSRRSPKSRGYQPENLAGALLCLSIIGLVLLTLGRRLYVLGWHRMDLRASATDQVPAWFVLIAGAVVVGGAWILWGGPARLWEAF